MSSIAGCAERSLTIPSEGSDRKECYTSDKCHPNRLPVPFKGATHPLASAATIATASPLAGAISLLGVLAALAYIAWRFGPTIARTTGWCSWWVAWACGSQGGYGYCIAFAMLGVLAWGGGTVWYARRRGHWPSALSARLLTRVLGRRGPLTRT